MLSFEPAYFGNVNHYIIWRSYSLILWQSLLQKRAESLENFFSLQVQFC